MALLALPLTPAEGVFDQNVARLGIRGFELDSAVEPTSPSERVLRAAGGGGDDEPHAVGHGAGQEGEALGVVELGELIDPVQDDDNPIHCPGAAQLAVQLGGELTEGREQVNLIESRAPGQLADQASQHRPRVGTERIAADEVDEDDLVGWTSRRRRAQFASSAVFPAPGSPSTAITSRAGSSTKASSAAKRPGRSGCAFA